MGYGRRKRGLKSATKRSSQATGALPLELHAGRGQEIRSRANAAPQNYKDPGYNGAPSRRRRPVCGSSALLRRAQPSRALSLPMAPACRAALARSLWARRNRVSHHCWVWSWRCTRFLGRSMRNPHSDQSSHTVIHTAGPLCQLYDPRGGSWIGLHDLGYAGHEYLVLFSPHCNGNISSSLFLGPEKHDPAV